MGEIQGYFFFSVDKPSPVRVRTEHPGRRHFLYELQATSAELPPLEVARWPGATRIGACSSSYLS